MIVFTLEMHLLPFKAAQICENRDLCSLQGQHFDVSLEMWYLLQDFLPCLSRTPSTI